MALLGGKVKDVERDRNNWRVFTTSDIERIKAFASKDIAQSRTFRTERGVCAAESFHLLCGVVFTGIGGFDIGFESAGFSISMQCEVEPFCQTLLKKHYKCSSTLILRG